MPSLRTRLRTILIVVALAASAFACERMRRLRAHYLEKTRSHAAQEATCRNTSTSFGQMISLQRKYYDLEVQNKSSEQLIDSLRFVLGRLERDGLLWQRRAAHHAALRRKYEFAASHPWMSVPPDPPAP
jgi:hypothetical protein